MTSSIRAITNAVVHKGSINSVPYPKLRDDYIIIKTKAVGLNPTDWKHIANLDETGVRVGCDYAGTVEQVGSKVTKPFKKGDRVTGFIHGSNILQPDGGAFAEYSTAKGDIQIKIPENVSFEEAATLGVGITTVGQSLYQALKLPLPGQTPLDKTPVLIYGGSTATGALAIQFAKLSGATVITTCSPHSFDYVKSLGADAVFDYRSPTCSTDIKTFTNNTLAHVMDCVAEGSSTKISVSAMRPLGGTYAALLYLPSESITSINPNVTPITTMAYTAIGEPLQYGERAIPASAEDFAFAGQFWELARGLLADGKIRVHRPAVNKYGEGFEGVLKGLDALKEGKVSGEKLVFTL